MIDYKATAGYGKPFVRPMDKDRKFKEWRSGKHAANPAEAQALVAEIDSLRLERDIADVVAARDAAIAARDEAVAKLDALRRALHTVHYAAAADARADAARIAELFAAERACDEAYAERDRTLAREEGAVQDALAWRNARDEVGIQLAAAQAEIARMKPVVEVARIIARGDGTAMDLAALRGRFAALDTVPGDALAPSNVKGGE